jgi:TatD DNase family protein
VLVDTHVHLNMEVFDNDRETVVQRAVNAGVEWMLDVGTNAESSRKSLILSDRMQSVFSSAGIHPHEASKAAASDLDEIKNLSRHPKTLAIGEIGLDYHYQYSPCDIQKKWFSLQLELALSEGKPVVIHVREAMPDALEILAGFSVQKWKGVFHCYGGDQEDLPRILEMGFHVSFTGVVTFSNFKNSDLISQIPMNRLLVETDAPYMTPVPFRGRRNEPAWIAHSAQKMADLLHMPFDLFCTHTTQNARRLFHMED